MALLAQSEKPDSLHQDYGFDMGNHLFTQIVYCFILNIYMPSKAEKAPKQSSLSSSVILFRRSLYARTSSERWQ